MASVKSLVESLKRLYAQERCTKERLKDMVIKGSITESDYTYITGSAYKK